MNGFGLVRVAAGPKGGQFAKWQRPEASITLPSVDRFGAEGEHVQSLLDRVRSMTPDDARELADHAPFAVGADLFAPNADALSYDGLVRYRAMVAALGPARPHTAQAVIEADIAAAGLPAASAQAVQDAAVALVTRGRVHSVAYDALTRAVRHSLGPIHPGDGPVRT